MSRDPGLLFDNGEDFGADFEAGLPDAVCEDIFIFIRKIDVNGVVAVRTANPVQELKSKHLRVLTEKPVVCFLPGETGAVDTALLPGANADGLAVLHIADRIGLGIFKRDKCNDHIPHGRIRERFVFRHEILQQRSIDAEVVVSLLKGDTEDILAFLQSGHVIGINLDDVVVALFLRFQDLQGFFRICRGDNAVGDFFLQVECGGSVAGITQGCPIPIGTQAVGTAGTDVRTGNRRELCVRSDKVDLPVHFAQRQADCRAGRGDMLEAGCAGKAGGLFEFLDQLP